MNIRLRNSKHFEIYKLMEAKLERNIYDVIGVCVWNKVNKNVTVY